MRIPRKISDHDVMGPSILMLYTGLGSLISVKLLLQSLMGIACLIRDAFRRLVLVLGRFDVRCFL